jgi:glyoxylase-like metal-dependent hydrolase (beta-lactamase superfamily II)
VSVRVDHAVSSGTFSLDGETFEVDNNIWVIGDDDECIVIDAPHDVADILAVVGGRTVKAIVCTHAHDDHVRVAPELREKVGGAALKVLHTPGHAPGAVCLYVHDLGCVFTGDTLFQGGPGATGRSFSDEDLIKKSIRAKLFALPDETVVHTGHGDDTTIGAERAGLE